MISIFYNAVQKTVRSAIIEIKGFITVHCVLLRFEYDQNSRIIIILYIGIIVFASAVSFIFLT